MRLQLTFLIFILFITSSLFSQTRDSITGDATYDSHRFTPDYKYMLLSTFNTSNSQKIYDTNNKKFIDWDDFQEKSYEGHSIYNIYTRNTKIKNEANWYSWKALSTVKNSGNESFESINPIISVQKKYFIRVLADGSFLCKRMGSNKCYILKKNGKKKSISHKFPKKFKRSNATYNITYDGKYGAFKKHTWVGSESFQAFEIHNLVSEKPIEYTLLNDDKIIEIAYVTDSLIVYECWGYYAVADWKGNIIYKLSLNRMAGGTPNRLLNFFEANKRLYAIQKSGFKMGQEGGTKISIVSFDKKTGAKITSKTFTSAIDIVPVKDNEFMVLYRDYNEHLEKNYDVNRYVGVGEGMAVEYIDESFNSVEFKYLQNSTRKASREKWQPPFPQWVSGIRKFQVVEHQGVYKMVTNKELFGFRLSDNTFINNSKAKGIIKLANNVDPNLFLCNCTNKYCNGGYVQNVVRPAKKFDTKFVQYETSSNGVTYKKTTTFKAGDDSPYSYNTKCTSCKGDGFFICKNKITK